MSQNGTQSIALHDPEVRPKAKRRQFTAEYKKRILDEAVWINPPKLALELPSVAH